MTAASLTVRSAARRTSCRSAPAGAAMSAMTAANTNDHGSATNTELRFHANMSPPSKSAIPPKTPPTTPEFAPDSRARMARMAPRSMRTKAVSVASIPRYFPSRYSCLQLDLAVERGRPHDDGREDRVERSRGGPDVGDDARLVMKRDGAQHDRVGAGREGERQHGEQEPRAHRLPVGVHRDGKDATKQGYALGCSRKRVHA